MSKDDVIRLKHIFDAAIEALGFISGKTRADFDKNRMLALSLIKEIEIIGEAASKISSDTKSRYPHIPWGDIVGMRNYLIHAYFDINFDIIWKTTTEDLPFLATEIEKIILQEDKG